MKNISINILKFSLPLALGILLIVYIYKDLSLEDKQSIITSFKNAKYSWISFSILLGIISHISRAHRWAILLEPMGFKPKLYNSFFAVMVGYLANLAFPRLGEVSRCAIMTKYEKIPFEKAFGTVMAERVIDMVILLSLTVFTILSQINLLSGFLKEEILIPLSLKFAENQTTKIIYFVIGIMLVIGVSYFLKKYIHKIYSKLKILIAGFSEGFKTILKIKNKALFIFHSLFIWVIYFFILYVCFFSLTETNDVSIDGVLSCFIFGSFGIIAVQGGIGAYPAILTKTLILYGIAAPFGFALGWIVWTGQTLMILVTGVVSILLLPAFNKKYLKDEQSSNYKVENISA